LHQSGCNLSEDERRHKKELVMRAGTAQEVQPAWLRYPEAERYSGLGRSTLWKLVKDERIRAAKVGKAVRINRHSLDEYMEQQAYTGAEE
jgi:excisionase family DNA binding protein